MGVLGSTFIIKNRALSNARDIISYGGNNSDSIRGLTGKSLTKDDNALYAISVNEARLFSARPDNMDWKTCFRPMFTLKPAG